MASNKNHEWSAKQNTFQVKDHFIFTVESVGALPPGTLVGMVGIFIEALFYCDYASIGLARSVSLEMKVMP